jgi:hypothetical protein
VFEENTFTAATIEVVPMTFIIARRLLDEETFFPKIYPDRKSTVKRFKIIWCRLSGRACNLRLPVHAVL